MKNEKRYWLDNSRNVDRLFWGLCGLSALSGLADFFYDKQAHFSWESWTNFSGWFGFVSCVGLVLVAKQLRKILQRREDYYDQ
jgi:hypothetical protein